MPRAFEGRRVGVRAHHLRPLVLGDFVFTNVERARDGDGEAGAALAFPFDDFLASSRLRRAPRLEAADEQRARFDQHQLHPDAVGDRRWRLRCRHDDYGGNEREPHLSQAP